MAIFIKPPPPPPPDLWDSWIRDVRDAMSSLQWRAEQGALGRWYTPAGEPVHIVRAAPEDGRDAVALALGPQPDRFDVLLSEQAATIAAQGTLSTERSATIVHNGQAYGFRLRWTGEYVELAAVAM